MPNAMMNKSYTPVSCQQHSELELAVMHKKPLQVTWQDDNHRTVTTLLTPVDVITREHAEYLIGHNQHNEPLEIRLDRITRFSETR